MCTNYTPTSRDRLLALRLGVAQLPQRDWPDEVFPGNEAPVIRAGAGPLESGSALDGLAHANAVLARFGLVPRWSRDARHALEISRGTYNARSETAATKPSFRSAWRERRFALVPMQNFFEPCWESGRAVRWRIGRADGDAFAVAALWEAWTDPATGEIITSFSMLTVNADDHALMCRMHRPGDEKRMLVLVPPERWADWLNATPAQAAGFMACADADHLMAEPAPLPPRPVPRATPIAKAPTQASRVATHPPQPAQNTLFE